MNRAQLEAARKLLLAHHEQADKTPRLRGRRDAYRTALACVEAVQAAAEPSPPVRVQRSMRPKVEPTVIGDYRPTGWMPENATAPTLQMTLRGALP